MAKRNTPQRQNQPRRANAKPTVSERKATQANKLGYDSVAAMQAVRQFYNSKQSNVTPRASALEGLLASQGWGVGQTAATPVNIGGARWLTGAGQLTFTGQRSDAAKRNPGAAYGAPGQIRYGSKGKRGKGKGGAKGGRVNPRGNNSQGGLPGQGVPGDTTGAAAGAALAAAAANQFTTGVSGSTNQFITEAGQSSLASGEAESPTTKKKNKGKGKKRGAQAKKLVKRGAKKAGVKPRVIRRAIASKGTSAREKKLYASTGNKKLSSRLRLADRRINTPTKKRK